MLRRRRARGVAGVAAGDLRLSGPSRRERTPAQRARGGRRGDLRGAASWQQKQGLPLLLVSAAGSSRLQLPRARTHTHTHARTHARTHERMNACTRMNA